MPRRKLARVLAAACGKKIAVNKYEWGAVNIYHQKIKLATGSQKLATNSMYSRDKCQVRWYTLVLQSGRCSCSSTYNDV